MILSAPTIRAPWMTLSPIPPRPNTTTLAPGVTFAVLTTAPDPRGDAAADVAAHLSNGASSRILATAISGSTVKFENVEQPM